MSVGVIIVAGGRGARLGASVPKQLIDLGGRSMLRRSVEAFDAHPDVAELVVVLPAELVDAGPTLLGVTSRPCVFTAGGDRRQDSVQRGVGALSPDVDLVLIHDAARPFVDGPLIDRVIAGARATGAAVPAVQARDTVKHVTGDRQVVSATIPRAEVWLAQTPQGFQRAVLRDAMAAAGAAAEATDEAWLVEQAGRPVQVVPGDERNRKVTTPEDLATARLAFEAVPRVGTGYDLHRLVAGRRLVLAGVVLSDEVGPESHSDGDVVCHALVDALLGAAAAGDIGRHFPNTDPQWKDAAGLDLLARAMTVVRRRGYVVGNVDVTVVLERPKVGPSVDEIRGRLAEVLGVAVTDVNVKGKTNEQVDAVGRGDAIAAHAVAMLRAGGLA
jgi:2-C-methyl-D-erythritol 4-phosphate cytidylyltransferase/2-C-methyl-D-erythritol 2,4-cyclodiphosphate synthase